ncbi:MAG: cation-translocating P-type ATPase [Flavobacteriales bacterium]|nr:cation-translocating P-type ATPase [Flavobacteriales bacterium]
MGHSLTHISPAGNSLWQDRKFLFLFGSVIVVVAFETLALLGVDLPLPWAPIFFAAFILAVGWQVIWEGLKALIKLRFSSISLLMLIAVVGAFYLHEFPEAAVVITLYALSEKLEDIGIARSKSALDNLVSSMPKVVSLKSGGTLSIEQVSIGSTILVKPGEMIALDGVVTAGNSAVDEATITGEPLPKDKRVDDLVYGGTLNRSGALEVRTTRSNKDTTLARIVQLTFAARANRSHAQRFIERFARIYTPSVLVLAILLVVIPVVVLGLPFDPWFRQAITILVIACPCALVISTPVAIYSAIGNAGSKGAVIKGGKYLEALAELKVVSLDKTRTLTYGKPIVSDVITFGDTTEAELLGCAAGAELFSEHPLAEAIVARSRADGHDPHAVENFNSTMGKGIHAECLVCDHDAILVGKLDFITENRKAQPEAVKAVMDLQGQGKTAIVVSFADEVAGVFGLTDRLREDSKQAVGEIKAIGLLPVMLTGDNQYAAEEVAKQVGIQQAYGALLPEDKAARIVDLQASIGPAAHVGDGVNDAPAFATSSVGIAMGALGSDTAIETADVALMNDDLRLIPYLVLLARASLRRIRFNTALAIVVKFLFLLLAVFGKSNLVLAIAADVGVTVIVILTSLQLMRWKPA